MWEMNVEQLMHTVKEIAEEAGVLAQKTFINVSENTFTPKADGSPVTPADLEVDTFIRKSLISLTPYTSVLSEEAEAHTTTESTYWIVDPIDGTANFIQKIPFYTISIALIQDGIPVLGVVHAPSRNETYTGFKGGGATRNGISISSSPCKSLSGAKILLDHGSHTKTVDFHAMVRTFLEDSGSTTTVTECASLELCKVAEGTQDGFIHRGLHAWDIAAGIVIAQAAGAVITDLQGNPKMLFESGIIASSKELSPFLVSITKVALDEEASGD